MIKSEPVVDIITSENKSYYAEKGSRRKGTLTEFTSILKITIV